MNLGLKLPRERCNRASMQIQIAQLVWSSWVSRNGLLPTRIGRQLFNHCLCLVIPALA
jgi:hypothetical protein